MAIFSRSKVEKKYLNFKKKGKNGKKWPSCRDLIPLGRGVYADADTILRKWTFPTPPLKKSTCIKNRAFCYYFFLIRPLKAQKNWQSISRIAHFLVRKILNHGKARWLKTKTYIQYPSRIVHFLVRRIINHGKAHWLKTKTNIQYLSRIALFLSVEFSITVKRAD